MGSMLSTNLQYALTVTSGTVVGCVMLAKIVNYLFPWLKYDMVYLRKVSSIMFEIKRYGNRKPIYTMIDR